MSESRGHPLILAKYPLVEIIRTISNVDSKPTRDRTYTACRTIPLEAVNNSHLYTHQTK